MQKIVYIGVEHLHPHPDNPRKNLGDLTELAGSIKEKGVLQNLTVVPMEEEGEYRVIIGHRRHAAGKIAGLTELPCVVATMTPQEQFETMMVENVQRSDLTVYEQAYGFQIMLDMGGTVEQVAQKTGFSETTVRNRVRLLTLDKEKFQKAESRGGTLKDYLKLNMIRDPVEREKVLDAIGTNNFNNMLKNALDDQQFAKELADALKTIQEADWCKEKTDETVGYSGDYKNYRYFDKSNRKPLNPPKDIDVASYIYATFDGYIAIYRKGPEKEEKNPDQERHDRLVRKLEKINGNLQKISNTHKELRVEFIQGFTAFSTNEMDIQAIAAKVLGSNSCSYVDTNLLGKIAEVPVQLVNYNPVLDKDMWSKLLFHQPLRALLCAAFASLEYGTNRYHTTKYDSKLALSVPQHDKAGRLDLCYECLRSLGYEMSDEEIQMQDGSHPLFQEIKDLIAQYQNEKDEAKKKDTKKKDTKKKGSKK